MVKWKSAEELVNDQLYTNIQGLLDNIAFSTEDLSSTIICINKVADNLIKVQGEGVKAQVKILKAIADYISIVNN
jgi:hypothetical protein